jgi:putative hydrolase of the HAD superfamily
MTDRIVLWDFDGTLAWRPGLWGGCVAEVLDELLPGHGVAIDTVREGLRGGFPWHAPTTPHPHLSDAEAWLAPILDLIAAAVERAGVARSQAERVARAVRERFIDPSCGWQLFDDTVPALARLSEFGWSHVVLSNHVPELPDLVRGLGLTGHFKHVVTSARIGYEKPHAEAFRAALRMCGNPRRVWMVGDNPVADVGGAEAIGLPAILVRSAGEATHRADGLADAAALILAA